MIAKTHESKALKLASKQRILRPKDLDRYGIPRKYLYILYHKGLLDRIDYGLYASKDAVPTENRTLVEVTRKIPNAVICLLSALQFHNITTQAPYEVWAAIDRKAKTPKVELLPVRIFRFSGKSLTEGIERRRIEGTDVSVYNPAKTVADCFKYRNKIGLDVAIEALRDCRSQKKCDNDQIWRYAKICRVTNVMLPYMEAIL